MNLETRYIRDYFSEFPLGQEDPGSRSWLDNAERELGGDARAVTYYFNEWRYRGTIEPGNGVRASFGCSHALGYGVQTPYAKIIGFANCAISGISNDAIARMAYTYCEQFSPDAICVLWTHSYRREHVHVDGNIVKFKLDNETSNPINNAFVELQNDHWDEYNFVKNKLFLENYCLANNVKLLQYVFEGNDQGARDGMHPGPNWHVNMAATILEDLNDS